MEEWKAFLMFQDDKIENRKLGMSKVQEFSMAYCWYSRITNWVFKGQSFLQDFSHYIVFDI